MSAQERHRNLASGPKPAGRWVDAALFARALRCVRRRPGLRKFAFLAWATVRSFPYLRQGKDPSQFGEGALLAQLTSKDRLYLDIGCNEPVRYNNTWLLRQRGWRGWSVDASDLHAPLWRIFRRKDRFLHRAVIAHRGADHVELFEFGPEYSLLSTTSVEQLEAVAEANANYRPVPIRVAAQHVEDLLKAFETRWGRYPSLLLTDVEGLDWALIEAAGPERLRERGVAFLLVEDLSPAHGAAASLPDPIDGGGSIDLSRLGEAGWSVLARTGFSVLLTSRSTSSQCPDSNPGLGPMTPSLGGP